MFRPFRALQLFIFSLVALVIVLGAEASQVVAESFLAAEEDRMLAMVNDHRTDQGLEPLESNQALRWVARRHTSRMVSRGDIYHNPDLAAEADEAVPGWRMLGENVGTGPSLEAVQDAFLRSEKHRTNIEQPGFDTVGIGGAAGPNGRRYFTQDFAAWNGPPTPSPAPPTPATPTPPPSVPTAADTSTPVPSTQSPVTAVVTPSPITPQPPTPSSDPVPDDADGATVATESLEDEDPNGSSDGGRLGFFELLLGLLARFVEKLGIG